MWIATLTTQALLGLAVDGDGPVRFGVPLPAKALPRGLRVVDGAARLQWRPLQARPDPETGRLWIELALDGLRRERLTIAAGGVGPCPERVGPVYAWREEPHQEADMATTVEVWQWSSGAVDRRERRRCTVAQVIEGEAFGAGEVHTVASAGLAGRAARVRIRGKDWRRAGVLPGGGLPALGPLARDVRARLGALAAAMPALQGLRGRGDYVRSGDVVTNLEFDTTLGLARLGLALARPDLLRRAAQSARHLVDHDMHDSGLPYRHGKGHRRVPPEPGHAWLTGLLLVGCLTADDGLIVAARSMARGLARHPRVGTGLDERARNVAWPLLEMEAWLRFADDADVAAAADALAADLERRWDSGAQAFRFGEGERRAGGYEDRVWLTGGLVHPALRAHLARRPSRALAAALGASERRLLGLLLQGKAGLPLRERLRAGVSAGQVRLKGVPEGCLVLEGVAPEALARVLRRRGVQRALRDVPREGHEDLATHWSMVARCGWVLR